MKDESALWGLLMVGSITDEPEICYGSFEIPQSQECNRVHENVESWTM